MCNLCIYTTTSCLRCERAKLSSLSCWIFSAALDTVGHPAMLSTLERPGATKRASWTHSKLRGEPVDWHWTSWPHKACSEIPPLAPCAAKDHVQNPFTGF
jgi:hypothetical protein